MNFDTIGEMTLGSRLRHLSDKITKDAQRIYNLYQVELKPNWFPIFYYLSQQKKAMSITSIAKAVGHSHPSVIKIIREMSNFGLVKAQKDKTDGRKNNIILTEKGGQVSKKIENQYIDVENAIKKALEKTKHNIWIAMQEFEYILNEEPLFERVLEQKKIREQKHITIVNYKEDYLNDFRRLNEEWITTYFEMEDADRKALNDPENYILKNGGKILVAIENDTVLGVCALLKMKDEKYDYELAKMAVSPKAQGKGIGTLLGKAIINKAKQLGAKRIYLESNTILRPALSLYEKLGFRKILGHDTPYKRCNIQMELNIN